MGNNNDLIIGIEVLKIIFYCVLGTVVFRFVLIYLQ